MKSGMQMMLESMLGADGLKAVEECKRILPAMPQLMDNLKREWDASKERQELTVRLLERIATQNNVLLGKIDQLRLAVDPTATEELPPSLAATVSEDTSVMDHVTTTLAEQGAKLCSECGALFCEHRGSATTQ